MVANCTTGAKPAVYDCLVPLTIYMTACDLEQSFAFEAAVQIIGYIRFPNRYRLMYSTF